MFGWTLSEVIVVVSGYYSLSLDRAVGESAFGADAVGYHAARLSYPDDLYEELFSKVAGNPRVLEIGAGTGLVTQALLSRNVSSLTAVEPDPTLTEFTARRLNDPRLTMLRSTFPDALVSGEFDLIACAAAFHWMEPAPALAKVRELLSADGVWAMWWHSYLNPGIGDELADQISPLLRGVPLPPSFSSVEQHYSLDEKFHRQILANAGFANVDFRVYRHDRELTTHGVLTLFRSYSFVRLLPEDRRVQLLNSIEELVDRRFGGSAPNIVLTPLYVAKVR